MSTVAAAAEVVANPNDDLRELGVLQYGNEQFLVTTGRSPELADRIIEAATEPHMQRMVPKDSREGGRFSTPEEFEKWYAKGRFLVSYWDKDGDLAAVVWHGPSSLQKDLDKLKAAGKEHGVDTGIDFDAPADALDTMAIRIYAKHRGKGRAASEDMSLARRLLTTGQQLFEDDRAAKGEPVGRIWLETNRYEYDVETGKQKLNGAVFLYKGADYQEIGTFDNPDPKNREERVVMVTEPYGVQRAMGATALQLQPVGELSRF